MMMTSTLNVSRAVPTRPVTRHTAFVGHVSCRRAASIVTRSGGGLLPEGNEKLDDPVLKTGPESPITSPDAKSSIKQLNENKSFTPGEAMAFSGPAPEIINGRLAMIGIVAGLAAELATGKGILQQVKTAPGWIAFAFGAVIVASLIPIVVGGKRKEEVIGGERKSSAGPLTPRAEVFNGQMAMLGFASVVLLEGIFGKSLLAIFESTGSS